MRTRGAVRALVFGAVIATLGCAGLGGSLSAGFAYRKADLPESQIELDVPYRTDAGAHPEKHRLDLFRPAPDEEGWPTIVFVHGGGWTAGDRTTNVLGVEPMRNIGRFYAAHGFGVAVISYRLQPSVSWRDQVSDVSDATAFAREWAARNGGNPDALVLAGHSAGAWLAAWVGLSDAPLSRVAMNRASLCALVLVSGAAYDLADEETYALGADREYFETLFGDDDPDWVHAASIVDHIDEPVAASLILSAGGEPPKFRRQGDILFEALQPRAPRAERIVAPGGNHQRIVVAMSREADFVSDSVLAFLAASSCEIAID